MANQILIRLSVHPCIRKYLLFHYAEPFFVTERGWAPACLLNMLERVTKVSAGKLLKKDKIIYGETIGLLVGEATVRKYGSHISSENVKLFNEAVLDQIYEEMYRLITQMKHDRFQVDDTIRGFLSFYRFTEDELPFDNAKRWYYRERERLAARAAESRVVHPQYTLNFFEEVQQKSSGMVGAIFNQTSILTTLSA